MSAKVSASTPDLACDVNIVRVVLRTVRDSSHLQPVSIHIHVYWIDQSTSQEIYLGYFIIGVLYENYFPKEPLVTDPRVV